MATIIQLRRDTAANWTANNPILADGEPGLEKDTGKEKIGDGVKAWNSLAYKTTGSSGQGTATEQTLTDALVLDWDLSTKPLAYLLATSGVGSSRTLPNTVLSNANNSVNYQLFFKQDSVGGRTIEFEDSFTVLGSIDKAPNKVTIITLVARGTDSVIVLTSEEIKLEPIGLALSDEITDLAITPAAVTFRMPSNMQVTDIRLSANSAPTGSSIIVNVKKTGVSVFTTKLSIDVGEKTSTTASVPFVLSDRFFENDAEITIDIEQVGSTVPGTGLKIIFIGNKV